MTSPLVLHRIRHAAPRKNPVLGQMAGWEDRQQSAALPPKPVTRADAFFESYQHQPSRPRRDLKAGLRTLQQHYAIVDSEREVMGVLEEHPTLLPLLVEAVRPLRMVFGETALLKVRVQKFDEECLLKGSVQVPADFADPENALELFDLEWWIHNCHRSSGPLVFDYEMQDAI